MIENILIFQDEYLTLLEDFHKSYQNNFKLIGYLTFLEKINIFWMKRIEIIEKELAILTRTNDCILLSGSLYLDINNYEHFPYITFGHFHLLHESLLKVEPLFRLPNSHHNFQNITALFIKILKIEMTILKEYKGIFLILPLELLYTLRTDNRIDVLDQTFWTIISSLFEKNFNCKAQFLETYKSFEEIENAIAPEILENIIFTNINDSQKSLRNRIQDYLKKEKAISEYYLQFTEPEIFISVLFGNTSQVLEILYLSQFFNVKPYIRYNIAFHYFKILTKPFSRDPLLNELIIFVNIFYVFHHAFNLEKAGQIEFIDYVQKTKQNDYLKLLKSHINQIENLSLKEIYQLLKELINIDFIL